MFHQILQGFIDLGSKLDFLPGFQHASLGDIESELAEFIV
jgi:hypothetical protein